MAPARLSDFRPEAFRRTGLSVFLERLKVDAFIGVHAHERGQTQPLLVDVEAVLAPGRMERLSDTLNYETIAARAREIAAVDHVDLVEDYAERLGRTLLLDPRVLEVRVRVRKPRAIEGAEAAGCEASFTRE